MEDETELTDKNKNSCACYFLEPGKDKQALDKVKSLGYDRITNLTNDGISLKKGDVILIIKNDAYIHPNPDDHRFKDICLEMKDLLAPPGISDIQNIPRYKLNDFLIQEKKDMDILNDNFLSDIPINRRTETVCMKALNDHPGNMEDIPDYLFTEKRVERILDMNYHFIADLPKEKLNEEICLNAIRKNSSVFLHMPQEVKTEKVCIAAYEQARMETDDPAYLKSIVGAIPHGKICIDLLNKYAYSSSGEFDTILTSISKNVLNREIAEQAVKLQEYAILTIPENLISQNMVQRVIEADANLLYNVPDRYKTRELCLKAVQRALIDKTGYIVLGAIPYPDIILDALKNEYKDTPIKEIVQFIPKEVLDEKLAYEIIRRDASCLPEIPFHLKDNDLCIKAILETKDIEPLYAIPKDSMSNTLCQLLITIYPQAFGLILPEDKRTADVCFMAIRKDETLKQYVPDSISNDKNMNIYRFGLLVDKQVKGLSLNQIQDLYDQKRVEIDYTNPTSQISRKVQIEFCPDNYSINYFDNVQDVKSQRNKQENTIPHKGKGLKM